MKIPIFNGQLEKSRDTTTVSNLRAAYAEAQVAYLSEDDSNANVTITKTDGAITSIAINDVVAKGVQSGYAGNVNADLPFTAPADMGGTAGTYTVTFTYGATGTITGVSATKNP